MKITSFLTVILCFFLSTFQAQDQLNLAKSLLLETSATKLNLKSQNVQLRLTHQHKSDLSGASYYHFIQTLDGVDIKGTDSNVVLNGKGESVKTNSQILSNLPKRQLKSRLSPNHSLVLSSYYGKNISSDSLIIDDETIRFKNDPSEMHWDRVLMKWKGKWIHAYTYILEDLHGHLESIVVHADSYEIIEKTPFTHACTFHNHSLEDSPLKAKEDQSKKRLTSTQLSPNSYYVFAYPLQSPLDGQQSIQSNPWLEFPLCESIRMA